MKKIRRIAVICIVLVMVICFGNISVFAATTTQDGLEVTLTTDKKDYSSSENIVATLTVKNTNEIEVTDVLLENIIPDGYKIADGTYLTKEIDTLGAGESVSFHVTYMSNVDKTPQSTETTTTEIATTEITTSSTLISTTESGKITVITNDVSNGNSITSQSNIANVSVQTGGHSTIVMICLVILLISVLLCWLLRKKKSKQILSVTLILSLMLTNFMLNTVNVNAVELKRNSMDISVNVNINNNKLTVKAKLSYNVTDISNEYIKINSQAIGELTSFDEKVFYALKDNFDGKIQGTISIDTGYIKSMQYTVTDDKNIELVSGNIAVNNNWSFENYGFILGLNTLKVTAYLLNGEILEDSMVIFCNDAELSEYLLVDTNDDDKDGLNNYLETYYDTDPKNPDTDSDGVDDYTELCIFNGYNPNEKDSDLNGVSDGNEDYDSDGLTNAFELSHKLNPVLSDTDDDMLSDFDELNKYKTDALVSDTDKDGADDGWEISNGFDPLKYNSSFEVYVKAESKGSNLLSASVSMTMPGNQVQTLTVESAEDNIFSLDKTPGAIGGAYNFRVNDSFSSAVISFEFDNHLNETENFDPVIYYVNEEEQELIPLETTVKDNTASAEVSHFSKYMLIDRTVYEESFEWKDVWSDEKFTSVEIVLIIDDSGSMWSNDDSNERLKVAQNLVDKLPKDSKIGIVAFGETTEKLTTSLISDKSIANSYLTTDYFKSDDNYTYMYDGINNSFDLFESNDNSVMKMMVVLSDGIAHDTSRHLSVVNKAIENNVKIYTVGLGNSTSYFNRYMKPLASETEGSFYLASNASQLTDIYKQISEKIDIETDSDSDGIPDYYEENLVWFNNVSSNQKRDENNPDNKTLDKNNPDTDGDGLKDGEEVTLKYHYNADKSQVFVTGNMKSNPAQTDTDGDGKQDNIDKRPMEWDVCDRDLAMFAALCYEDGHDFIDKMYEAKDIKGSKDGTEIGQSYYWLDYAKLNEELFPYWKIADFTDEETYAFFDKFSATTYVNGDNVIVAYRGTNDGLWEWVDNIIYYGLANYHLEEGQAQLYIEKIYNRYIANNPNAKLYITGHSLGGYLCQIGTAELILKNKSSQIERVAYFNGIGMKYNKLLLWEKNDEINALKQYGRYADGLFGSRKTPNGKLTSYQINGDLVSALGTHYGNIISYDAATKARVNHYGKHGSYSSYWSSLLTLGTSVGGLALSAYIVSPTTYYYYVYYSPLSFVEYVWITHETDSFLYYLKR